MKRPANTNRVSGVSAPRRRPRRRAALLLEVVIALTIMVAAVAMLGSQLVNGLQLVQLDEKQTRAAELADRMLALLEMDQALLQRVFTDQEDSGDFGQAHPGYFWRVRLEPTPTVGLGQVTLTILFNESMERLDSIDAAKPVRTVSLLKADPGKINLATDFGASEAQMEALNQALPLLGIDPTALNPQDIVSRDPLELFQLLQTLLPIIQQYSGGQLPIDLSQVQSPEQMMELLNQLQNGQVPGVPGAPGGGAGQPGSIEDLIRLRDQLGGDAAGGAPGAIRSGASPQPPRGLRPNVPGRGESGDRGRDGAGGPPRGAGGARPGGARGGTGQDQPMSIEDLMRFRDELNAGGALPPPGAAGRPGGGRPGGDAGGGRTIGGSRGGTRGNTGNTPGGGRGNGPTGGGRGNRGGFGSGATDGRGGG